MKYDVDSVENRSEAAVERAASLLDGPLKAFFNPVVRGLERIPRGAGLYVANHNGGVLFPDVYIVASAIFRARGLIDTPYALAHDLAIRPRYLNELFAPLGAVRAAPENAHRLFEAGHKVLVYPGGDVENLRPFRDRDRIVFGERRGYVRLAIREGVPIIPVVSSGAHSSMLVLDDGGRIARLLGADKLLRVKVCPVVLSFPWGLTIGLPPPYLPIPTRIYTEVLEPIHFEKTGPAAAADSDYVEQCHLRVIDAMQVVMTRLAKERHADKRLYQLSRLRHFASRFSLSAALRRAMVEVGEWLLVIPPYDEIGFAYAAGSDTTDYELVRDSSTWIEWNHARRSEEHQPSPHGQAATTALETEAATRGGERVVDRRAEYVEVSGEYQVGRLSDPELTANDATSAA